VTAIPSLTGGYGEERQIESLGREFPQAHLRQAATPDHCTVLTETGAVGDVIRQVAENHHVDLVLINRGHLQQPYGKFQTHVYDIVLESPCPVLSVSFR
jgi:hypothetical protein